MDLRDRHMDQGAGVLDLEDLDDDDDVQSEVSLQMPGSYPRIAWNDPGMYPNVKGMVWTQNGGIQIATYLTNHQPTS